MENSRQRNMRAIENALNEEWNRGHQSAQEEFECERQKLMAGLEEANKKLAEYEKNGYTIKSHKTSAETALKIANIRLVRHGLSPINSRAYRHEPEWGNLVEAEEQLRLNFPIGEGLQISAIGDNMISCSLNLDGNEIAKAMQTQIRKEAQANGSR